MYRLVAVRGFSNSAHKRVRGISATRWAIGILIVVLAFDEKDGSRSLKTYFAVNTNKRLFL